MNFVFLSFCFCFSACSVFFIFHVFVHLLACICLPASQPMQVCMPACLHACECACECSVCCLLVVLLLVMLLRIFCFHTPENTSAFNFIFISFHWVSCCCYSLSKKAKTKKTRIVYKHMQAYACAKVIEWVFHFSGISFAFTFFFLCSKLSLRVSFLHVLLQCAFALKHMA